MADLLPVAIADTSALVAFFNKTDKHHSATRKGIAQVGHLVVSPCMLAELDYLVSTRHGPPAAGAIVRYIASRVAAGRGKCQASDISCWQRTRCSATTQALG